MSMLVMSSVPKENGLLLALESLLQFAILGFLCVLDLKI